MNDINRIQINFFTKNKNMFKIKITITATSNWTKGVLLLIGIILSGNLVAATITSGASGSWSSTSTWVGGVVPSSSDNVIIAIGHSVTTAAITRNSGTTTEVNGTLIATAQLTLSGTMSVSSGGIYQHNFNGGSIPAATWSNGSTCTVTGMTNTAPTGMTQSFHHVIWNCTGQTADFVLNNSSTLTWLGNFTVSSTGSTTKYFIVNSNGTDAIDFNISGNLNISGGVFVITANSSGYANVTVNGNMSLTNTGTFYGMTNNNPHSLTVVGDVSTATGTTFKGHNGWLNNVGTWNFQGNVDFSAGTVQAFGSDGTKSMKITINLSGTNKNLKMPIATFTGANCKTNWSINVSGSINMLSDVYIGGSSYISNTFAVTGTGTLNMNGYVVYGSSSYTTFSSASGSTIKTAHTAGIVAAGTAAGAVQTATRTFNAGANYVFNGSSAQVTGNFSSTVANLEFNNSQGVTLSQSITVSNNGNFTLTSGYHNLSSFILTLGTTAEASLVHTNGGLYSSTGTGSLKKYYTAGVISSTANGFYPFAQSINEKAYVRLSNATVSTAGYISMIPVTSSSNLATCSVSDNGNIVVKIQTGKTVTVSTTLIAISSNNLTIQYEPGALINPNGNASDLCLATYTYNTAGVIGTHSTNTGSKSDPQVIRTNLSIANLAQKFVLGTYSNTSEIDLVCLLISNQPSSGTKCPGAAITPEVKAKSAGTVSFQWQYSSISGGTFNNIIDGTPTDATYVTNTSVSSGETTGNLSLTGSPAGTGYYKCLVSSTTANCSNIYSSQISIAFDCSFTYYSNNSSPNASANSLTNWNTNIDGISGSTPLNFTNPRDIFIIQSGHKYQVLSSWAGSSSSLIQIQSGGALDINAQTITTWPRIDIAGSGVGSSGALLNSSSNASNLTIPISLTDTATITSSGTGGITITGNIDNGGYLLTINAINTTTISSGIISGLGALIKSGVGSLTLASSNTFSGGVTLSAGTLNINNSNALGVTGSLLTIENGTTINNTSGSTVTTVNYPLALNGDFTFSGTNNLNLGTGSVSLSASRTITTSANTLTIGGAISETSKSISKSGNGTLAFDSQSINLRDLTINTGTLSTSSSTITLSATGTFTNNSTFTAGTGTIAFLSTGTIAGTGIISFNNLTITGGGVVSNTNITVNGVLHLAGANTSSTSGALEMGSYVLTMDENGTTTGTGDVTGIITRNNPISSKAYTFGNQFTSLYLGNGGTLPSTLSIKVVLSSDHTWKSSAIHRYYSIIQTGATSGTKVDLRLHYLDSELNGVLENSAIDIFDYHGSSTIHDHGHSGENSTNNWIELAGLSLTYVAPYSTFSNPAQFKYYTLGQSTSLDFTWIGVLSTDWNTADNWSGAVVPLSTSDVIIPDATTTDYDPIIPTSTTIKSISIANGGVVNGGTNTTLTLNANTGSAWMNDNGTLNPGTSTIVFAGSASLAGTTSFNNVTVNSGVTLIPTLGTILKIAGDLTLTGTLDLTTYDNTLEYNGNSSQTVANTTYHDLTFSGSGTKNLPATLVLQGNWTNNTSGSLNTNNGTVNFNTNGAHAQTIGGTTATTFNNLTLNNSYGISLSDAVSPTINGALTFTDGKITTNTNAVIIGVIGTISGAGTGWIIGTLTKQTANNGSPSFTYPIGISTGYLPVSLTFSGNNTAGSTGSITVSNSSGDHAQIVSSGIDNTKSVNRNWTITNSGISGFTSYSPSFTYFSGDNDASTTPSNFVVRLYSSSSWAATTISSIPTSTTVDASGFTNFGDIAIGEKQPLVVTTQPTDKIICQGTSNITFNSTSSSIPTPTIEWQRGINGVYTTIDGSIDNAVYTDFITGALAISTTTNLHEYTYRAVFSNINGTVNSNAVTLTINNLPSITGNSSVCKGTTLSLTGSGTAASNNAWISSSQIIATINSLGVITPQTAGTIDITYTDNNGCTSVIKTITVFNQPTMEVLLSENSGTANDGTVCSGTNVTLTASGATSYSWDNSITNGVAFSATNSTSYTVTGTDANGCINTAVSSITVNTRPTLTSSGTISSVNFNASNQNSNLVYSSSTNDPASYSIDWDATANTAGLTDQATTNYTFINGGGTISSIVIKGATQTGNYNGTLTYTTIAGCSGTQAVSIIINSGTITFYYDGSGSMSMNSNWGSNTDGTGTNPSSLIDNNLTFYITDNNSSTPFNDATWILGSGSKIIIGNGTNSTNFTITNGNAITGTIDVSNNATLTITSIGAPTLGSIDAGSTIVYGASSGIQTIPAKTYGNLTLSNSSNNTAGGAIIVNGTLALSGRSKLILNENNLTIGSNGKFSGYNDTNFIVTNSTGKVIQNGLGSSTTLAGKKTFPIGISSSSYTPIILENAGTTDDFSVRVAEDRLANGTYGGASIMHAVDRTWFVEEGTPSGSNVEMIIQWNAGEELSYNGNAFNRLNCFISHYTNNAWDRQTGGAASGSGPYTISRDSITSFSPFSVEDPQALPITLIDFTAKAEGKKVRLDWETGTEENNDYFTIERSLDSKNFEQVFTKKGAGNSKVNLYYFGYDSKPYTGVSYYRLKQTDFDGKFAYSDIVSVKMTNEQIASETDVYVYPNPITNQLLHVNLNTKNNGKYLLKFTNKIGQQVFTETFDAFVGTNNYEIQLPNVTPGMYILEITNEQNIVVEHLKITIN